MELNSNMCYIHTYSPLSDKEFEWCPIFVPLLVTEIYVKGVFNGRCFLELNRGTAKLNDKCRNKDEYGMYDRHVWHVFQYL